MASKLMQPPIIPASHSFPQLSQIKKQLTSLSFPTSKPNFTRFKHYPSSGLRLTVSCTSEELNSGLLLDDEDTNSLTKASIYQAVEGINRGVFGVTSGKKREIEDLVMELEANNPTSNPTHTLDKIIDIAEGKAVNIIKFSARGLNLLNGELTIQASFSVVSPSRVNIKYDSSQITPEQLMNLFKKNFDLLLSIFNPEGWLEITYVDNTMRIGRDDKGNIFILERTTDN